MPALQFSLATLSGLINGNQADSGGKGGDFSGKKPGGDQFSSLLDVVGNIGDSAQAGLNKKDEVKDPAAVEVNAAQPFRDPLDKTIQKVVNGKGADKNSDNDAKPTLRAKNDDAKPAPVNDKAPAKPAAQAADNNNKPVKAAEGVASDAPVATDEVTADEELKEKISAHVDNLSELLNIIAQLMARMGAGNQIVAVSVQSQVKISVVSNSEITVGDASQKTAELPEIFADLKNNLAQLQQFLQGATADGAVQDANGNLLLSEEQNAALAAINDALQNDLNALKNLLPQGLNGDDKKLSSALASVVSEEEGEGDEHKLFAQAEDVKKLLEDDISLIKEALRKFKDDRAVEPLHTNAPKLQAKPLITTVTNTPQLTADNNKLDAVAAAVPAVQQAAVIAVEQPVVQQQSNTQQGNSSVLPVAAAVQSATSSDSNSSSNFSGNSGQNNNAAQQFSVAGTTATSARANAANATSQFAGMLNRAQNVPVTEQVVFHVKTAVGSGNSKITIQLNPEELGKLDITLDVDSKGKTGVTITADNKQALDLLQKDSSGLQKALNEAGLKTDAGSLSFNLRGGEREGQGQNQYQASSQYQKSQPEELLPEEVNMASLAAVTRSYTINVPDGLDIKI